MKSYFSEGSSTVSWLAKAPIRRDLVATCFLILLTGFLTEHLLRENTDEIILKIYQVTEIKHIFLLVYTCIGGKISLTGKVSSASVRYIFFVTYLLDEESIYKSCIK